MFPSWRGSTSPECCCLCAAISTTFFRISYLCLSQSCTYVSLWCVGLSIFTIFYRIGKYEIAIDWFLLLVNIAIWQPRLRAVRAEDSGDAFIFVQWHDFSFKKSISIAFSPIGENIASDVPILEPRECNSHHGFVSAHFDGAIIIILESKATNFSTFTYSDII